MGDEPALRDDLEAIAIAAVFNAGQRRPNTSSAGENKRDTTRTDQRAAGGAVGADDHLGATGDSSGVSKAAGLHNLRASGDGYTAGGAVDQLRAAGNLRTVVGATGADSFGAAGQNPSRISRAAREHIKLAAVRYDRAAGDAMRRYQLGAAAADNGADAPSAGQDGQLSAGIDRAAQVGAAGQHFYRDAIGDSVAAQGDAGAHR